MTAPDGGYAVDGEQAGDRGYVGARLPAGWLRDQLRETLPSATDEQIESLVRAADEYGRQLREARERAQEATPE